MLLFCSSHSGNAKPDVSDGVFFIGCLRPAVDMFTGYLQDVRVYAQSLDLV